MKLNRLVKGVHMNYLVKVFDDYTFLVERVVFSYRDEALHFADIRRKQGFLVKIISIIAK